MRFLPYCLAAVVLACSSASASVSSPALQSGVTTIAELGRKMFFDPSLSASGKLACATCHDPQRAYGPPPGKAIALGGPDMARSGTRAVPSLRYLRGSPPF